MSTANKPATPDYGPRTAHPHDPRADIEPMVDLADRAQQDVFQKLLEGSYGKVTARDVFALEYSKRPQSLYEILEQLAALSISPDRDIADRLIHDAAQIVHDYLEGCGSYLVDARAEEIAEEEAREAEEESQ